MKSVNPIIEKKVKEIVRDSKGIEAAKKIAEYYTKNSKYHYYGYGPDGKPRPVKKGEMKQ